MSDNPRAQLEIGADASQAEEAFAKLKESSRDAATRLAADGKRAATGIGAIGDGASDADQKIDRSTRSMIASIQRATAVMEAGGTANAAYYKSIAQQRGVDTGALAPYLKQLEEATLRQNAMGTSAKGMARQMGMVAPQLTDIVVSLQSGQAPMTVLLQQGGQLKDMFGGIGGAAKALGGYIASLVTPYTVAAAAAVALGAAMYEGASQSSNLNKALIMSGNVSGQTAGQLTAMAASVAESVGTQGKAMETLGAMASNSFIAATGDLKKFATVAGQMDSLVGVPVADTIKHFEDLGRSPVEASIKLNEQYGYLTASIFKQIQALQDQGKAAEAAALAQRAFADAMEGRIPNIKQNLGYLETAWFGVRDAAKGAWDMMLGIGRQQSPETRLADITAQIKAAEKQVGKKEYVQGVGMMESSSSIDAKNRLKSLKEELSAIQSVTTATENDSKAQAKANAQREASIKWIASGNEYLTKSQKLEQEITKIRNEGSAAGASQAEIESRIAAAREKYAEHTKKASRAEENAYKSTIERIQELASSQEKEAQQHTALTEAEKLSLDIKTKLASGVLNLSAAHKALVIAKMDELLADEKLRTADAERVKAIKTWSDEYQKSSDSLDEQIKKQKEHNDTLGQSKEMTALLASSKLDLAAATDEARAAQLRENAAYAGPMYDEYMREASMLETLATKRRQLAQEMRTGAVKEAGIDAAKETEKAWEKAADQINQALTDALMRGFEDGKSFGQNFIDSLRNSLKTSALKIFVQAVTSPMTSTISGVIQGGAGSGGSGSQYGTYASLASAGGSLWGAGGTAASFLGTSAGGTAGGLAAGWSAPASSFFSTFGSGYGAATSGAGYGASGAGQMTGSVAKVAWPLAIAYGMFRAGKAYDAGFKQTDDTFGGGRTGNYTQAVWDIGTMEPLVAKIVGDKWAAIFSGSSLTDMLIRRWFGRGGPQVGGSWTAGADVSSGAVTTSSAGGWWSGLSDQQQLNPQMQAPAEELAKSLATAIKSFGGSGSLSAMFAENFDPRGDSPNDAIFKARVNGKDVVLNKDDQGSKDPTEFGKQIDLWRSQFTLMVAQASDIPKEYADFFAKLDATTATSEQISAIFQTALAIKSLVSNLQPLKGAFAQFDAATVTSISALADSYGGLDQLTSSINTAYDALLTDSEKQDLAAKRLKISFDDLGVAMPNTDAGLRSLIEAQDLNTESGRKLYASLLALAPGFSEVQASAESAKQAAADAVASIQTSIDDAFLSPAEQLAKATKGLSVAVPGTVSGWKDLITAQDLSTESGRTLAQTLLNLYPLWSKVNDAAAEAAASLASQRRAIEIQIMEASGDTKGATAAKRSDELAAADPSLRALLKQLYAAQDAATAAQDAANAQANAASAAENAADQLRSAWQTLADGIASTVRDLRAELSGDATQTFAERQAQFAIATEAARAGDQTAAGQLSTLAKSLIDASKSVTSSAADQTLLAAQTLASLEETVAAMAKYGITMPKFAAGGDFGGGLRIVGERGPELEATGPSRIFTHAQLSSLMSGGDVADEIRALRAEVAALREANSAENLSIARASQKTANAIDRVIPDGEAMNVRVAA